jgi:outer membrane protein TolC
MSLMAGKKLNRKQAYCLMVFFLLSGCSSPDNWYDIEKISESNNALKKNIPVDTKLLPEPQWRETTPLPLAEGGSIALSLEQAVFFSLQRNRELQVERYTPLITGTFEQIERGVFDAEFFSEIRYSEETASETSRSTEERFNSEGDDVEAVAGLRQQFPSGTDLEASAGYRRSTSNRTPEQQEIRLGLSVTQSLLRGFGAAVNLAAVRQTQLETQASLYEFRGFVEALLSEVEIAYWRYVLAAEGLTIFEQSLTIAEKQLSEVESQIEVGVIPRNSAAAARAEVARREQALLEGRSRHIERRLRLLRLLNVTDNKHFQLLVVPTSQPRMETPPLDDLDERLELALLLRPDLNEARLRQKRQSLEVVRTRNGLLPKLELFIDLGKTGYAESFSTAWSNIDEDNYDLLTGIEFSSYLGNRTAEARHLAARASRDQAGAAVENLKNMVQLDVRLAANETERTRQQIAASAVTREMEEQTLEAEQERFSVGDTTSLLVAQAQRDLLVSRLAEIEAIVEYRIALVNLFLAEGSLLERRGIQLDTIQ